MGKNKTALYSDKSRFEVKFVDILYKNVILIKWSKTCYKAELFLSTELCPTNRGAHPVQSVLVDRVTEPHLAVQRMFLIVAHKVDQTLKLCRTAQHEETAFLLDTTVFDLTLRPTERWTYFLLGCLYATKTMSREQMS